MAIHTFGECLDSHPHLHALVADGLFARSGSSTSSLRPVSSPWRGLFLARAITFLIDKGLLSGPGCCEAGFTLGFNVHRGGRVRSPASARTWNGSPNTSSATPFGRKDAGDRAGPGFGIRSILYRCGMNKKIGRNFEIFTPCDFIKMRGRRAKQGAKTCRPRATPWR